jgi:hypothetical protein
MKATYSGNDINSREGDAGGIAHPSYTPYPSALQFTWRSLRFCLHPQINLLRRALTRQGAFLPSLLYTPTALAYQLEKEV